MKLESTCSKCTRVPCIVVDCWPNVFAGHFCKEKHFIKCTEHKNNDEYRNTIKAKKTL